MKASNFAAALTTIALWSATASAQQTSEAFLANDVDANALRLTVGLDPAMAFGLGYLRVVDLGTRRLGVHVDTTAIMGFSSWDITAGVSVRALQQSGFDVLCTLDLRLDVAQNDVHTAVVYGYGASVRPGWFGATWFIALDLAARGAFATTLTHHAAYRRMFPEVVDGTYTSDHLNLFAGAVLGFEVGRVADIGARFAWRMPRTFESYAPYFMPYTFNLDVGLRF